MKRLMLAVIPLALLLTGCLEMDQELTIRKDGSAQIKSHVAIPKSTMDLIEASKQQDGGGMTTKTDVPVTEEDVRKKFADMKDVKLSDVKVEDKDGKRHISYVLESKDLATLVDAAQMNNFNLTKNADGSYIFWSPKNEKPQPKTEEEQKMQKQMQAAMIGMLKGLKFSMKVTVPTEIVETTAPEKTATSARWAFDLDKDPSFIEKEPEFRIIFKGDGLKLPEIKAKQAAGSGMPFGK